MTDVVDAPVVEPSEEEPLIARSKSVEWRAKRAEQMKGTERRVHVESFEMREDPDDGMIHLSGYATVYETPYDMGWYTETIGRGALRACLNGSPDTVLNLQHGEAGSGLPIARTTAGNLTLTDDAIGLRVEAILDPEDPDVQLLYRKRIAGNLDGAMSLAFRMVRQIWSDDYTERRITELSVDHGDVSCVIVPANPAASSSIRSDDAIAALRHIGPLGVLEAFGELRRYASTPRERRDGMEFSATVTEVLTQILNLCALADDAMDEAQPLLAAVLGVPNPDEDEELAADDEDETDTTDELDDDEELGRAAETTTEVAVLPSFDVRADRARLESLRHAPRSA